MAVAGVVTLSVLAIANELCMRDLMRRSGDAQMKAMEQAEATVRNAQVIEAMGMLDNLMRRWELRSADATALPSRASVLSRVSNFLRLTLQTAMLGVGAWLVIANELTLGGMVTARAYLRLKARFAQANDDVQSMLLPLPLPKPQGALRCEEVPYRYANDGGPDMRSINLDLPARKLLGISGATASGKSTLARLLVGIVEPRMGHVRLDNMDVANCPSADRGRYVGYLPQDVELFAGTIRENIVRMSEGDADEVIAAARLAGMHELILRLPKGYETEAGEAGRSLASGQRQRIALARSMVIRVPISCIAARVRTRFTVTRATRKSTAVQALMSFPVMKVTMLCLATVALMIFVVASIMMRSKVVYAPIGSLVVVAMTTFPVVLAGMCLCFSGRRETTLWGWMCSGTSVRRMTHYTCPLS
jgi:ABC-type protease/lipase transport system fused ATPase/permease subunit